MAQRYGGKHSPRGPAGSDAGTAVREAAAQERQMRSAAGKATILFVPPVILVFTSLNEGAANLATALVAAGVLTLAAWLLRDGLKAEVAYHARPIARRPALPRKMLASGLTGIGIALAAVSGDNGITASVLYGIIATALHVAAFGIDPLRDKRMEGVDTFQQDRVARVVDEAEDYLNAMTSHIAQLGNRGLTNRVAGFQAVARKMIRTVEEDPRDLTAARRYLGVYLMGARDATVKFADLFKRTPTDDLRNDYEALLSDLETNFAAKTQTLLEGDRTDMDIEIKVLRDRLARDGITAD